MAKAEIIHEDKLGNLINVGDYVAYPSHNSLEIGVVTKLNPKMVKVKNITPTNYKWRSEDGKNKYPSDCVMVEGPLVTMYILKNNENNDKT